MINLNKTKAKLKSNKPTIGTFIKIGDPTVVEILGLVGYDFIIIDSEHVGFDKETITNLIRAAELQNITTIVRTKSKEKEEIMQMLDIGAQGVQVPNVDTKNEANQVLNSIKYFPIGSRGLATTNRSAAFGLMDSKEYVEQSNNETLVVCHCESKEAVENLNEILEEDIDVVFIGPMDLSQSFGKITESNHPRVKEAIKTIISKTLAAGKEVGIVVPNEDLARQYINIGVNYIAIGSDQGMIANTSKDILNKLSDKL